MFEALGDGELIDVISSAQRAEAQAASRRLTAIGVLVDRHADPGREDLRDRFAVDRWDEVAAQVAAAQGITHALASHQMRYAYVLRYRLRAISERFAAGDIVFRTVALIIARTELVEDDRVVAAVDAAIAEALPRWERWSVKRLTAALDALVYRHDRDAVRRAKTATDDRHLEIRPLDTGDPLAEVWGVLQTPHAVALNLRLNQLARTVCAADPRTHAQLRADAVGPLTQCLDQMRCACGDPDCAGRAVVDSPVVVNLVVNQDTLGDTECCEPALVSGFGVVNSAQARQMAMQPGARVRSLIASEGVDGYRPTRALAAFVRCRDLMCRFPGCSHPADSADLDHSVPYADGGSTAVGNLKALCRKHHLLKCTPIMNAPDTQVRAGCDCRTSSDPNDKREGVDRQRADITALREVKGWTPAAFYIDNDRSASNGKQRPEWDRLQADINAGTIDAIAAWDQDRAAGSAPVSSTSMKSVDKNQIQALRIMRYRTSE